MFRKLSFCTFFRPSPPNSHPLKQHCTNWITTNNHSHCVRGEKKNHLPSGSKMSWCTIGQKASYVSIVITGRKVWWHRGLPSRVFFDKNKHETYCRAEQTDFIYGRVHKAALWGLNGRYLLRVLPYNGDILARKVLNYFYVGTFAWCLQENTHGEIAFKMATTGRTQIPSPYLLYVFVMYVHIMVHIKIKVMFEFGVLPPNGRKVLKEACRIFYGKMPTGSFVRRF